MKSQRFIILPCGYGRNHFAVGDSDRVYGAILLTQVTDLAVLRIADFGLLVFLIDSDDISRACEDAGPTTDAAVDSFDSHVVSFCYRLKVGPPGETNFNVSPSRLVDLSIHDLRVEEGLNLLREVGGLKEPRLRLGSHLRFYHIA